MEETHLLLKCKVAVIFLQFIFKLEDVKKHKLFAMVAEKGRIAEQVRQKLLF